MLSIIYLVAITAEAMTGVMEAARKKLDAVGVCAVASVAAFGGGTLRDVVLGHYPVGWVANPKYLLITVIAALVTVLLAPVMHHFKRAFLVLDALGLVAFSLIGCAIARDMQLSPLICMISGMMTGVFGGVLRDVLCNEIPLVFQKELYAVVSLLTAGAYWLLLECAVSPNLSIFACLIGGFSLRMVAIYKGWEIPKFIYKD